MGSLRNDMSLVNAWGDSPQYNIALSHSTFHSISQRSTLSHRPEVGTLNS